MEFMRRPSCTSTALMEPPLINFPWKVRKVRGRLCNFGALDRGERLLDVSWAPNGQAVLLLSKRPVAGGTRFHLRFVATTGEARDLVDLPAQPVAGSWIWAPDGHAVAFLVHSQTTALVTLDLTSDELRYSWTTSSRYWVCLTFYGLSPASAFR
jgi:hypothetical protein